MPRSKPVPALAARRVDPQMRREAGAVLARPQRAQIVRQRLGQHRHDAVGEIDRVAAPRRLAVERAARPRHRPATSAIATTRCQPPRFAGSGSGSAHTASSKSRASLAVDRDQRQIAQIGAALLRRIAGVRERAASASASAAAGNSAGMSNAAIVSRLIASGRRPGRAVRRMRARLPKRRDGRFLGDDQLAVGQPGRILRSDAVLGLVAAIRRRDDAAVAGAAEHADDPVRPVFGPCDVRRMISASTSPLSARVEPRQGPLAVRQLVAGRPGQAKQRRLALARPVDRANQRKPVGIAAGALDMRRSREARRRPRISGPGRAPPRPSARSRAAARAAPADRPARPRRRGRSRGCSAPPDGLREEFDEIAVRRQPGRDRGSRALRRGMIALAPARPAPATRRRRIAAPVSRLFWRGAFARGGVLRWRRHGPAPWPLRDGARLRGCCRLRRP